MRILAVNDDGWDAPGLQAMVAAASNFGTVFSVAPLDRKSGCGHQLTFDRSLSFIECGENAWHVDGMPADCVRLARSRLGEFDWVLSGINNGSNLGVDVYHSGTVAAAREAMILGMSAASISLFRRNMPADADWQQASRLTAGALHWLTKNRTTQGSFWNVNLPEPHELGKVVAPQIVECPLDPSLLALDYEHAGTQSWFRGKYHARPRKPGHDIEVCFSGKISATRIWIAANG